MSRERRRIRPAWLLILPLLGAVAWIGRSASRAEGPRWPHEPEGLRLISEQPWDAVPSLGWHPIWGPSRIVNDSSAPGSPPHVLEIRYPAGFVGGSAPGTVVHDLPHSHRLFIGMWWWADPEWQGHETNVNKVQFLFPVGGGDITMVMYGHPGGPYEMRVLPQFLDTPSGWLVPNAAAGPVTLGQWHRIEWVLVTSSAAGVADGICRWWIDDQLAGTYTGLQIPSRGFEEYKLSPTWGGAGDAKGHDDMFRFDEIRIAGR